MVKPRIAGAVMAAALVAALLPAAASAATLPVLSYGSAPAGPAVTPGDVLSAPLRSGTTATFRIPGTPIGTTCAVSNLTHQVLANSSSPGTAQTRIVNQTFNTCTSTIPGVTSVTSVVVNNLPYTELFSDAAGLPVTVLPIGGPIQFTITEVVGGPTVVCVWRSGPPLMGNYLNGGNQIMMVNQPLNFVSGPGGPCGAGTQLFSATYAPLVDSSKPTPNLVWVN